VSRRRGGGGRDYAGLVPFVLETRDAHHITAAELYPLLRLRTDVFVVEQNCPYPELDGRDLHEGTLHVWAHDDGHVLGTIRVLEAHSPAPAIGRVATSSVARGRGVASRLLEHGIGLCRPDAAIRLSAQAHLETWYERFGFRRNGAPYDEDGIPHVPMQRDPSADTGR
jgi:ElaA protein